MAQGSGSKLFLLLIILAVAGVGGARNYQRNLAEGEAKEGPFHSYSNAALDSLIEAYQRDVEAYTKTYEETSQRPVVIQQSRHMDARIREFERVQSVSRDTRRVVEELARRQVALQQLRTEKNRRGAGGVKLFFKRLLSLPG